MRAKGPGRAVRDEADARDCFRKAVDGGGPLSEWARKNGVAPSSLYWWRQKFQAAEQLPPRIVEVAIPAPRERHRYVVVVGDVRLVVGDAFDGEAVTRLVQALRAC